MSVEGLWAFQSTSIGAPTEFEWGGVVVLETGRVLGGDSMMTYIGAFTVSAQAISATVRVRNWNPALTGTNVFGMQMPVDFEACIAGTVAGGLMQGLLWRKTDPGMKLAIRMEKMAELPG